MHTHPQSVLQATRRRLESVLDRVNHGTDVEVAFASEHGLDVDDCAGFHICGSDKLFIADPALNGEQLRYQSVPVILHELGHRIDQPTGRPEAKTSEYVQFVILANRHRIESGSSIPNENEHNPRWHRVVSHAVYRTHKLGYQFSVQAVSAHAKALRGYYVLEETGELERLEKKTLVEVCDTPPPIEFTKLWS